MKDLGIPCGLSGRKGESGVWCFSVVGEHNLNPDKIMVLLPYCEETTIDGIEVIQVGFRFNEDLDNEDKACCIDFLKNVHYNPVLVDEYKEEYYQPKYQSSSGEGINEVDLFNLVERELRNYGLNDYYISTKVCSNYNRTDLSNRVIRTFDRVLDDSERIPFIGLKIADPGIFEIDVEWCLNDLEKGRIDPKFIDAAGKERSIDREYLIKLQGRIRSKEVFSFTDVYPDSISRYVSGYCTYRAVSNRLVQASNVLVVDEVLEDRKELAKLIKIIRRYNSKCRIFVYKLVSEGVV